MDFRKFDMNSFEDFSQNKFTMDEMVDFLCDITEEDGTLRIPANDFYEGIPEAGEKKGSMVSARIKWTEENKSALKKDLHNLMNEINEAHSENHNSETRFLTPFPVFARQEEIDDIFVELAIYGDIEAAGLKKDQLELLEAYEKGRREFAEQILGSKPMAYECMLRAERLCCLLELKAPEAVINNERSHMVEAVTIYSLAEAVEAGD